MDKGLTNSVIGIFNAMCYQIGGLLDLPLVVMVTFDKYCGPTLYDGTVPVTPVLFLIPGHLLVYSQATDTT